MKNFIIFTLLIIGGLVSASAQYNMNEKLQIIHSGDITNLYFKRIYQVLEEDNGFMCPPFSYGRSLAALPVRIFKRYARSFHYKNEKSPFYVNSNRNDTEQYRKENSVVCFFNNVPGKYIVCLVGAVSSDHDVYKSWLTTFDMAGNIIDYVPFYVNYGGRTGTFTIEGEITADFTVRVYQIVFPDNDYIMKDCKFLNSLRGQRIDCKYRITPEGKFKLLEEVLYQPQTYTPEMLTEDIFISQRNEKLLQK